MNKIFYIYREPKFGFIKIFGKGISWRHKDKYPLSFIERFGYKWYCYLGKYIITFI